MHRVHYTLLSITYLMVMYQLQGYILEPFEKFVEWWQCAAFMQREAVTVMPSCSVGGNAVVA
jgi:hypothetical protein